MPFDATRLLTEHDRTAIEGSTPIEPKPIQHLLCAGVGEQKSEKSASSFPIPWHIRSIRSEAKPIGAGSRDVGTSKIVGRRAAQGKPEEHNPRRSEPDAYCVALETRRRGALESARRHLPL